MKTLLWLAAALASACLPSITDADPLRVMSAPNLLRVGTAENVFVEYQDYRGGGSLDVRISVWNYPTKTSELVHTSVTLNEANKYQALGELVIPSDPFDKKPTLKQYVYLLAAFPGYTVEKVVLVSFQSGYMFIQTDKTLYTPDSMVHFRVFAVTPGMKPVRRDESTGRPVVITVEMVTPEGVVIPLGPFSPNSGIHSGSYRLSDVVSIGQWKVVSRFQSNPQQTYSAEFEVKKYVLPSYEVKLTSGSPFYYFDATSFTVTIKATYLFGKEVDGTAYVVFGFMKDDQRKVFPASLQRITITGGDGVATLQKEHILQTYADINDLVGGFLFVTATVYTESGSEMVEGELRNIQIVKSPYVINFDKTPKYFKAGMPFDITVTVTHPDGTPARGVPIMVEPGENLPATSEANGRATVTINPRASDFSSGTLTVTARTNDENFPAERQTSKTMMAKPHQSKDNHFIHISMSTMDVKLDSALKVHLVVSSQSGQFDITYLILSRGQLVDFGRQYLEGATVVLGIPVTKKMLPSFRLIVYYHPSPTVVVSDSVWVDVDDSCMGTLKLEPQRPAPSYEPKSTFNLKITGEPGAKVGLVAVDKGVYVLNKKHLLTQKKVWEMVEKADTGCTPGGGANSMGVFFDAGLMIHTDTAAGTPYREEVKCATPTSRKRRTTLPDVRTTLTGTYKNPLERECCLDGMKSTQLSYTCEQRKLYITDGEACEKAFLHCCEELEKQRNELQQNSLILARSEEDYSYMDTEEIPSRTQFPESWQWKTVTIPACAGNPNCKENTHTENFALKDSITTWVFTGISLSENNGICVGDPLDVIAYQPFFIDLRLPYAAVVGEQIEIRAILHNYIGQKITVRVELKEDQENKDVCSAAWKRGTFAREVEIEDSTTLAVPFVIIPMKEGLVKIDVIANIKKMWKGDRVIKTLRVVPYGVLTKVKKVVHLDPKERNELTVNNPIPRTSMVPNTKANTKVFITGREQVSPLVENVIGASSMGGMIHLPTGCGEQNMYHMTQTVIATVYLDKTNQWEAVGLGKRSEALIHIKTGVQNEMKYGKPDGSFAVFTREGGSTWLTAYVVKVFSMANTLIEVGDNLICNAVKFLILNTQQPDGMFKNIGRIIHREYTGDVLGAETDASLTAFCLIALQETRICDNDVNSLKGAKHLSLKYLEGRLPNLRNPYAVAITSYALANANKLNNQNKQILYNFVAPGRDHWVSPRGHVFSLEATAYALLALVKGNFLEDARPIVRWFTRQQKVGGGYGSTQATIMVYQAVSEYWAAANEPNYKLNVELRVPGRNAPHSFQFTQNNHYTTRTSERFQKFDGDVRVILNGTGEATMTLVTEYYARPTEPLSDCTRFNLSVDFTLDKVEKEGDIYKLRMKFFFKSDTEDASMSILDISLPTGFEVMNEDLNALSGGRAAVISHWEYNKNLTEKGSIIFYLRQVAHSREEELAFRMRQVLKVGVLQPASVSIYEYYDETKCVKYYHPERKDGQILRRCRKEECLCAEENCSLQQKGHIDNRRRFDKLCESNETSRIDYAYHVIPEQANYASSFDIYGMRVDEVIKEGSYDKNVQGQLRKFLSFPHCRESLNIQKGAKYLIMGTADETLRSDDQTFEYLLGERTWIEHSPTEEECQTDKHRQTCLGIEGMIFRYETSGCKAK